MLADLINIAQVGLTVTFLLLCTVLIKTWWGSFVEALSESWGEWSPEQWLVVGIVIGFLGGMADQAYWGLHWLAELYQHSSQPTLLKYGPLSNLFARQIPGIVSIYCHLHAAAMLNGAGYSVDKKARLYSHIGFGISLIIGLTIFIPRYFH